MGNGAMAIGLQLPRPSSTLPNRRLEGGQSMSALPGYFRHQLVPLLPRRHRPRCRDTGPCFRSWYARAVMRHNRCADALAWALSRIQVTGNPRAERAADAACLTRGPGTFG